MTTEIRWTSNLRESRFSRILENFYRTQVDLVRSMCLEVSEWLSERRCWNFTDVTQADEDTNSILTDKVDRTIQGNVAMQL